MTNKIAVMILHGAGTPGDDFAVEIIKKITERFRKKAGAQAEGALVFEPVWWSKIFAAEQERLWERVHMDTDLDYQRLRGFTVEFLADAIAYQPASVDDNNYDKVHELLAATLSHIEEKAGKDAPLCVISHSLGSVIASNYFYDLQVKQSNIGTRTWRRIKNTPLENGETLANFYTMGSPMALWSLRFGGFGLPIQVPAPNLHHHHPEVKGEWLNFYDKDDILAYPLKNLNEQYQAAVTEDIQVNAGGALTSWNPLSHHQYDEENAVIDKMVDGLVRTWQEINQ
ncbi:chemotaxis protein [Thalassobacillus devorans]|uniref:chemotaxis protein n=1 Tax=Thalassobacillus devorans TaxID=279813 RepID=UPI0004920B53|nr:chemotaxis protein [Thalassobacillus devorans]